jgi:hypothetical protein
MFSPASRSSSDELIRSEIGSSVLQPCDTPIRSEIECSASRSASRCSSNISETAEPSRAYDRSRSSASGRSDNIQKGRIVAALFPHFELVHEPNKADRNVDTFCGVCKKDCNSLAEKKELLFATEIHGKVLDVQEEREWLVEISWTEGPLTTTEPVDLSQFETLHIENDSDIILPSSSVSTTYSLQQKKKTVKYISQGILYEYMYDATTLTLFIECGGFLTHVSGPREWFAMTPLEIPCENHENTFVGNLFAIRKSSEKGKTIVQGTVSVYLVLSELISLLR